MKSFLSKLASVAALAMLCMVNMSGNSVYAFDKKKNTELRILDAAHPIHLAPKSTIVAEGDSLTYGLDMTPSGSKPTQINGSNFPRSSAPYPETLAADLDHKVVIVNHGFPGDQTIDGIKRWKGTTSGDLTLVMFGTNDCGNFGHSPTGSLSLEAYHDALTALVKNHRDAGAQVVILIPPSLQDSYPDHKVEAYRKVAAEVAKETSVYLFDTVAATRGVQNIWIDGIHLSPEAYKAIAKALAADITIS